MVVEHVAHARARVGNVGVRADAHFSRTHVPCGKGGWVSELL